MILSEKEFDRVEASIEDTERKLRAIAGRCENWRTESICLGALGIMASIRLFTMHYREVNFD